VEYFFVYILASKNQGVLYIGVTNNLTRRVQEHKAGVIEGFTKKYFVYKLVYFETYTSVLEAIKREKQLKKWNREWKVSLIEKENPNWFDLTSEDKRSPLSRG
jgi:putative endonuclease